MQTVGGTTALTVGEIKLTARTEELLQLLLSVTVKVMGKVPWGANTMGPGVALVDVPSVPKFQLYVRPPPVIGEPDVELLAVKAVVKELEQENNPLFVVMLILGALETFIGGPVMFTKHWVTGLRTVNIGVKLPAVLYTCVEGLPEPRLPSP
jgi:hypothetical protein